MIKGKGGISAKIIADSLNDQGTRITTFELEYPRFFHSEVMTHRILSKNSASTRAIPVSRSIEMIDENPAMPIHWGVNNPGMQSKTELEGTAKDAAQASWLAAKDSAVSHAKIMSDKSGINGHKQWVGRILEPFMFMKVVMTGTEFANFFHLRNHKDAQPEFRELAECMLHEYNTNIPFPLKEGQWHLPYISTEIVEGVQKYFVGDEEVDLETAKMVSSSCCAQVSYRRLDDTIEKAKDIYNKLKNAEILHASPFEHQATPIPIAVSNPWQDGISHLDRNGDFWSGNFRGWIQHRKLIPNEAVWETK